MPQNSVIWIRMKGGAHTPRSHIDDLEKTINQFRIATLAEMVLPLFIDFKKIGETQVD
jgi:hypothetical protein